MGNKKTKKNFYVVINGRKPDYIKLNTIVSIVMYQTHSKTDRSCRIIINMTINKQNHMTITPGLICENGANNINEVVCEESLTL
jgi:hypothetical protein